jgi:hypothetical protein
MLGSISHEYCHGWWWVGQFGLGGLLFRNLVRRSCVDKDEDRVGDLKRGEMSIYLGTRNVFAPADARAAGLRYLRIGRPNGDTLSVPRASRNLLQTLEALGVGAPACDETPALN